MEPGKKVDFWKCIVPQEMLAEPNKAWEKWAGHYSERGSHECLICLDACPVGREEHERRVAAYRHEAGGLSRAVEGGAGGRQDRRRRRSVALARDRQSARFAAN